LTNSLINLKTPYFDNLYLKKGEKTSMLGWLSPKVVWESIFGNLDAKKVKSEMDKLNATIQEYMNANIQLEKKHNLEAEEFTRKYAKLQEEMNTRNQQIDLLVKKVNKRRQRVQNLKKVISEMASKINLLDQCVTETLREKDAACEIRKKLEEELRDLKQKWNPVEKLSLTPEKLLEAVQRGESAKEYLVFEETGSLEEDICKLQSILIVKLKELKAFGNNETAGGEFKTRGMSNDECEENKLENLKQRKCSHDFKYSPELKDIEEMLKSVECPFKSQVNTMQGVLEDYKGKLTVLEKKEKVLEKIMNTSVFFIISEIIK